MKFSQRSYEPELLDLGSSQYTQKEYEDCLDQLARIGRFLGGNQATFKTLFRFPKPMSILDVGCGGGQFTLELAKQFSQARVMGIDISSEAIAFAQKQPGANSLKNLEFNLCHLGQLPFIPNSFDVVTSTLVCHHLNDDQLIEFLKRSYQIAKNLVVINDLHRHWLAYSCFAFIAKLFFPNRLIVHDGLVSIKRAFKKKDWVNYLNAAGIPLEHCSISWHWAFRWVVCIDKLSKLKQ